MIKGILLDYGGTIDTNGIHWGEVIWDMYQKSNVAVERKDFELAYSHGERTLAIEKHIFPEHDFLDTLKIKTAIQFRYLIRNGMLAPVPGNTNSMNEIAEGCNAFAQAVIDAAKPVLEELAARCSLVLVSNFYGNIETVLKTFGIRHYFMDVVESAVVGVRKPDPGIFSLGVKALNMYAENCAVIGDSYSKDIVPGKKAGCNTIWLKGQGWGKDPDDVSAADKVIRSFGDLPEIIKDF